MMYLYLFFLPKLFATKERPPDDTSHSPDDALRIGTSTDRPG